MAKQKKKRERKEQQEQSDTTKISHQTRRLTGRQRRRKGKRGMQQRPKKTLREIWQARCSDASDTKKKTNHESAKQRVQEIGVEWGPPSAPPITYPPCIE
mmetsp:Transcript_9076/g.17790  ORF Transcript_9076/g.17790 Transcript_9076/m.17790 type:complete len:100 (-) Transcript_9076:319-618(-)